MRSADKSQPTIIPADVKIKSQAGRGRDKISPTNTHIYIYMCGCTYMHAGLQWSSGMARGVRHHKLHVYTFDLCVRACSGQVARHVGVNTVRDHDSGKETGNNMYHELQTFKTHN